MPEPKISPQEQLPPGVGAFQMRGPLFFGVASRLIDAFDLIKPTPKVFIIRMSMVPMIDSSGVVALEEFIHRCHKNGTKVILSGVKPSLMRTLLEMEMTDRMEEVTFVPDFQAALAIATEKPA
jgi:SulP family sulfate permease